jgi:hypothetical protein
MSEENRPEDKLLTAIRDRINASVAELSGSSPRIPAFFPPARMDRLEELSRSVQRAFSLIGRLPPAPPTLRGRAGRFMIRVLQRMLGWYTPQIVAFNAIMVEVVQAQTTAISDLVEMVEEGRREREILAALGQIEPPGSADVKAPV